MNEISIGDLISQFKTEEINKPSGGAKDWLDGIHTWLEGDYSSVVHPERAPGLHASGLGAVCARRLVGEHAFECIDIPHTAGNYYTFDVGHALHQWWQERYLGPKQELWGDWVCMGCPCPSCGELVNKKGLTRADRQEIYKNCGSCRGTGGKVTRGLMPIECECGKPWQEAVHYLELFVENKELKYKGHADGILLHKPNRRLFEFKTMSPTEYDKLVKGSAPYTNGPKAMHVIQAHAYMQPLGLEEALVVYFNKGSQCGWTVNVAGQFKALDVKVMPFLIKFDEDLWSTLVERVVNYHKAVELIDSRFSKKERVTREDLVKFPRICESTKCELAARCPVSRECFHFE